MARTLPSGLATIINSGQLQPSLDVTITAPATTFSQFTMSQNGQAGRSAAIVTSAGTLLIATQNFNTSGTQNIDIWRCGVPPVSNTRNNAIVITAASQSRAGVALVQTGSTIRLFYERYADSYICYRDSTNDGVTWGSEQVINISFPFTAGNYCYGLCPLSTTELYAVWADYDPAGSCSIYRTAYSTSWGAWSIEGPPTPSWGKHRGLNAVQLSGTWYFTGGAQMRAQQTGFAHGAFSRTGASSPYTYSTYNTVKEQDSSYLGLSHLYPTIATDGTALYSACPLVDDGTVSGTAASYTWIWRSVDGTTWTPYAFLGSVFSYEVHLLWNSGQLVVFDGTTVYTAPTPPAALDVSNNVLRLSIKDKLGAPSSLVLELDNSSGTYNSSSAIAAGSTVQVQLGYSNLLVTTHTMTLDTWTFSASGPASVLTLRCRDYLRQFDYASTRLLNIDGDTVSTLVKLICQYAGNLAYAALPSTTQFSQTLQCFAVLPGETWLMALSRLSRVFVFDFFADATPQLRLVDKASATASSWSYSTGVYAYSIAYASDQANIIQVVGALPVGSASSTPPFALVVDSTNVAATGREVVRIVSDRMLTSSAQCKLAASNLLLEEQRNTFAAEVSCPINPIHELGDAISLTDSALGLSNKLVRISAIDWDADFEHGKWIQQIHCTL